MKILEKKRTKLLFLVLPALAVVTVVAQTQPEQPETPVLRIAADTTSVFRCWILVKGTSVGGGPGKWLEEPFGACEPAQSDNRSIVPSSDTKRAGAKPIIRAGERLLVEQNSERVQARLQATALEPAALGAILRVRFRSGGSPVQVVAIAPGHASLINSVGAWR